MFCYQLYLAHSSLFTKVCRQTFTQVSVVHRVVNSALPLSYFAYSAQAVPILMVCEPYIYNKVEWQLRLIT